MLLPAEAEDGEGATGAPGEVSGVGGEEAEGSRENSPTRQVDKNSRLL